MKRIIYIVFMIVFTFSLSAAATGEKAEDLHDKTFSNYILVQKALAADDLSTAKQAFRSLAENSKGLIKEVADMGAESNNLKEMRNHFKQLSSEIAKAKQPKGYGTAYCPMAKSWWVQKEGKITNPYYGKQMLTCGSFKEFNSEGK